MISCYCMILYDMTYLKSSELLSTFQSMRNPSRRQKVPCRPRPRRHLPVQTRRRVRWALKSWGQTSLATSAPPPPPRPSTSPRTPPRTRYSNSTWPTTLTVSGFSLVRVCPLNIGVLHNHYFNNVRWFTIIMCYMRDRRPLPFPLTIDFFACPFDLLDHLIQAKIRESWLKQ